MREIVYAPEQVEALPRGSKIRYVYIVAPRGNIKSSMTAHYVKGYDRWFWRDWTIRDTLANPLRYTYSNEEFIMTQGNSILVVLEE